MQAGYDPREALNVFRFTKVERGIIERYTATHPIDKERIEHITDILPKVSTR